ncbi:MAG: hypothetical protein ACRDBP_02815 [Luteolibacter sp.]
MNRALAVLLLAFTHLCRADGLPYSHDGELHSNAAIIIMDQKQFEEVDTQRTITLNVDQKYFLKKLFKEVPDKLEVVSSAFNDNREDVENSEVHCIWMRDRVLAITYWIGANEGQRKYFQDHAHFVSAADPYRFVISSEAKVYRDGKELSFADMFHLIDELTKTPPDPNGSKRNPGVPPPQNRLMLDHPVASISFSLPPKVSWASAEDIRPESLLQAFKAYAATKQVLVSETW